MAVLTRFEFNAFVFDAVGTLIYPEPSVAAAYAAVGRKFGSKLCEAEVARRFYSVYHEIEERDRGGDLCTSEAAESARWQEIVRRVLDDIEDHAACFAALFDHFARPASWRVFADVRPVFEMLAARGVTVAIASNFDQRLIEIVRELKPLNVGVRVFVSTQIGYRKPHRRFFETVAAELGVAARELLYIGDDPLNDLAGAAAAEVRTLLVRRDGVSVADGLNSAMSLTELVPRVSRP